MFLALIIHDLNSLSTCRTYCLHHSISICELLGQEKKWKHKSHVITLTSILTFKKKKYINIFLLWKLLYYNKYKKKKKKENNTKYSFFYKTRIIMNN